MNFLKTHVFTYSYYFYYFNDIYDWNNGWIQWIIRLKITDIELFIKNVQFTGDILTVMNLLMITDMRAAIEGYK
jgi:hypothetical protein